jgi:hypothetical protein
MYKTKGFIIGVTLIALILIPCSIGLACGTKPSQTPTSLSPTLTKSDIPNYITYTDKSGLFSISYPVDWEITSSETTLFGKNTSEIINRLQSGLPIDGFSVIFFGGKPYQGAYDPYIDIGVEPVPAGMSTLDQILESNNQSAIDTYPDYRELSRVKTTVDGREAVILETEGSIPQEQYAFYTIQSYILTDQTVWVVTCGSRPENSDKWKNDFDTIVRSLRISD